MYPSSLVKIGKPLHLTRLFCQFYHIIFQSGTDTSSATAIIKIRLTIIIHKYTRIDHGKSITESLDISLYFKIFCRILACRNSDFPRIVPIRTARMRKIKIISSILISTIGSPHKTALRTSPRHLTRIQNLPVISPVYHIIRRKHMITIHQVTPSRRIYVV